MNRRTFFAAILSLFICRKPSGGWSLDRGRRMVVFHQPLVWQTKLKLQKYVSKQYRVQQSLWYERVRLFGPSELST
jgi:hypothetical protein